MEANELIKLSEDDLYARIGIAAIQELIVQNELLPLEQKHKSRDNGFIGSPRGAKSKKLRAARKKKRKKKKKIKDYELLSSEDGKNNPLIEAGKIVFISMKSIIQQKICLDLKICEAIDFEKKHSDEIELVKYFSEVLATAAIGVPVVLVSTLIVKIGARKICECD